MEHSVDHDGKTTTSPVVDAEHYPDVNPDGYDESLNNPSHSEIAALAHRLWEERGYSAGSHEQDWLEAETQLREERNTPATSRILADQAGSVQR